MIVTKVEEMESRERAVEVLSLLKHRRRNIILTKFYLEKDTYVYIEDKEHAASSFQRFKEALRISRSTNFRTKNNYK